MVTCLGSLVQSCWGEGGALQTDITGVCGERSQCLGHTGFAPLTARVLPCLECSGSRLLCRELSEVGPGFHALPRPKPLRLGSRALHKVQTRLGLRFVLFPGPSSSGDQVLCECTLPEWGVSLITSRSQPLGSTVSDLWLRPS